MVVKKDKGKKRVCIDPRALNNITEDNMYPIPRPDVLMDQMAGSKLFSLMDLTDGYHHIMIEDEDKHKTAFAVPGPSRYQGLWQWKCMPFGLKGAPATFQNYMDVVLQEHLGKFVGAYLDDVNIFSKTKEEHLKYLRTIFQILREEQIYAKKKKCYFMQKKIPYLGHYISEAGIETDPKKVESIKDWPTPTSVKQVRRFMGLAGYYRKFVKGFAEIVTPISELTKESIAFEWTDKCQKAFDEIKEKLMTAPILRTPDYDKEFTVTTDASDFAIGGVLSQEGHPVAFFSQKLHGAELNWTTHEKELFAVKEAITKWEHYLGQRHFKVLTDNRAVTYLHTQEKLSLKQARWLELFSRFNFEVVHVPGKDNHVADALSRRDDLQANIFAISAINNDNWLEKVKKLSKKLPKEGFEEQNGLLYKDGKMFIPGYPDVKLTILKEKHDNILGGHYGYRKTLQKVQQSYYWPKMSKEIKDYVESCDFCQRNKTQRQKPYGLLQPIGPPEERFTTYSIDFIGPLPATKDGYDGVVVIVEMLTKMVTIEKIKMTYGAPKIAEIIFKEIVAKYGMPKKIVSDRDPRFTSIFWKTLFELSGTELAMSTAYHPQTDGMTERVNQVVEQILRNYINYRQNDWDVYLPGVAYAINTAENQSTGFTPFEMIYGANPKGPIDFIGKSDISNPLVDDFVEQMTLMTKEARSEIIRSQAKQKEFADRKRRAHDFKVGDHVLVSNRNILMNKNRSRKLSFKYIGPFRICKQIGDQTFELDGKGKLPEYQRFHVSLLKHYRESDDQQFPKRKQTIPEPEDIQNNTEYEVEKILDSKRYRNTIKYLVKWKGYQEYDATWEPKANLTHAKMAIREYDQQNKG